jgi:hypothetical protein
LFACLCLYVPRCVVHALHSCPWQTIAQQAAKIDELTIRVSSAQEAHDRIVAERDAQARKEKHLMEVSKRASFSGFFS